MTFEKFGRQFDSGLTNAVSVLVEFVRVVTQNIAVRLAEDKKREEIAGLLRLDDNQLQDMGISHDDVRIALRKPLDFNAGIYLERVRRNKRML